MMIALATLFGLALGIVAFSQVVSLLNCVFREHWLRLFSKYVPDWRFFAPKPVTGRRYILGRPPDRADWVVLWTSDHGKWYRLLWNPQRRSAATVQYIEARLGAAKLADPRDGNIKSIRIAQRICEQLAMRSIGEACCHYMLLIGTKGDISSADSYHLALSLPADSGET